ncbi:MAG: hypothetical protein Q4C34_08145 [Bacteroidales bacterium]|nr:hypothetical protein [Bacteroidales bacterium]
MTKEIAVKDNNFERIEVLFPSNPDSSRLLIGCSYDDFAASRIARAIEDCDARLLNLNVTGLDVPGSQLAVALRVNHRSPDRVARSLERYGYRVISLETDSADDDVLRSHYDELMRYLDL